jgi:hypothetical protein
VKYRKVKGVVFASVFILLIVCNGYGQKAISFGKVSLEELNMSRYENDTTAEAVILSDIGKLDGNSLKFNRHIRIKVLKKSGLGWGNWTFNTPSKSDFKLAVFNLQNNEIVKEKIESTSIYKEEIIKEFEVYKVFAPSVRVGSIIDISYWHMGPPIEWRFQERIPVVYSELTLEQTDRINFSKTFFGLEAVETVTPYKWRSQNMRAFKTEPYLNNYINYITKFAIQLESISFPGFYLAYSTSWRKIIDNLFLIETFGGVLNGSGFLNDAAKQIKAKNLPVDKAIEEAHAYVQKNIKWNGNKSLFATTSFKRNFTENHSGNSAEVNLALIVLLNKIGINTLPVALSTRDNGLLVEFSPAFNKLNYVVAYVDHENTSLFLDATSEYNVPGILPEHCLNGRGLLIKKENEQWFTLAGKYKGSKSQYTDLTIQKDGEATATISRNYSGYSFLNWAEDLKTTNADAEIVKNKLQKEYPNVKIENLEINLENKGSLNGREVLKANVSEQLIDAGDEYLFNPFVLFEYSENPFKAETRRNPVDLAYPRDIKSTVTVRIPNEFVVKKIPSSVKFTTADGSANFTFLSNATSGKLEFMVQIKLNKYIFTEDEYLELRQFFSKVIEVMNTPVTFSKS